MSAKRGPQVSEEVSPNLIPMIDIMFLLLLFFMLGADMGQRELEEVVLPHAKSVKEDKAKKGQQEDRLTINVYHRYSNELRCDLYAKSKVCRNEAHWRIGVRGKDFSAPDKLAKLMKKEAAQAPSVDPKNPQASDRKVMIRGDGNAPFGLVQGVMNQCAFAGIYKIECGAAQPPQEKKRRE